MIKTSYLNLILGVIFGLMVIEGSTYGCRFWNNSFYVSRTHDARLVENLISHVFILSHEIGDRNYFKYEQLDDASRYIAERFASFGYRVEFQNYQVVHKNFKNIIASKSGAKNPQEIILIGAHYDACFNPGADDNASGIAALLELARIFSNTHTARSIKFVAFVNEEPPFFKTEEMGSRVYVRNSKTKNEKIKAALILESLGCYSGNPDSQRYPPLVGLWYPNQGNFVTIVGNFSSVALVKKIVSGFKRGTLFPIESAVTFDFVPGADFSDHRSFWKENVPAVMITDTVFYRNSNYHKKTDTFEKLNYKSMAEVIKGLTAVLNELSD